jgi:hypothetical protein
MATWDEAFTVAVSWTERVIQNKGHWGDSDWAYVVDIQEFKRGERLIGYFCEVEPVGFILVSLRKELAPIKAYSVESNLDPESDEGMVDLLKMKMEGILDTIEEPIYLYGLDADAHIQALLEIDYRPAWDELSCQVKLFGGNLQSHPVRTNYQEGRVLLTSNWHQGPPYNSFCPVGDTDCINGIDRTVVGCVATAFAQIMKYWNWPPRGVGSHVYDWDGDDSCEDGGIHGAKSLSATFSDDYDWLKMPDRFIGNLIKDQNEAVAELCFEIGVAIEMDYGVKGSGINPNPDDLGKVRNAYIEDFRFSPKIGWLQRYVPDRDPEYIGPEQWFGFIKSQLSSNLPIQYFIHGHSIVLDGWREDSIGKQYHMNYGWGGGVPRPGDPGYCNDWENYTNSNAWYTLDALPCKILNEEFILCNIYPAQAMGSELTEQFYEGKEEFNYRYFDQDIKNVRVRVEFDSGQNLQFLPGVKLECTKGDIENDFILFKEWTRFFSIKGMSQAEIKISNGGIKLRPGGSIRFY